MDEITRLNDERRFAHQRLLQSKSKVYEAFLAMEAATYANGALSKKDKELIAVGISVVINCESCMQWHIEQAVRSGATHDQIIEAIEVGIEMAGGPGTVAARFALRVLDAQSVKKPSLPNQLPDPTSPSVTPTAGAAGAPSVAADH